MAMAMGVEFSKYLIAPCGSFTKIARSEDGRVLYSLHTDESFSLFPRRNFNFALKAFLHCLGESSRRAQDVLRWRSICAVLPRKTAELSLVCAEGEEVVAPSSAKRQTGRRYTRVRWHFQVFARRGIFALLSPPALR